MRRVVQGLALAVGVACVGLLLIGWSEDTADPRPVLLWESAVLEAPSYARHSVVVLAVEDVTADGLADIVAVEAEHVVIYAGDGAGDFAVSDRIPLTSREPMEANPLPLFLPSAGEVWDLDEDGSLEILVGGSLRQSETERLSLLFILELVEGRYEVSGQHECSGPPQRMALRRRGEGRTYLWLANGLDTGEQVQQLVLEGKTVVENRVLMDLGGFWYVSAFADVDQDGLLDVLSVHIDHGIEIAFGETESSLADPIVIAESSGIRGAAIADLDGDGQQEVVGYGAIGVAVFSPPWPADPSQTVIYDVGHSVRVIQIRDLNGDRSADIVAVADKGQRILILAGTEGELGSLQTFIPTYPIGSSGCPLLVEDFNDDGAPDLVLGTTYSSRVMMNGGSEPWGTSQIPFGGDKLLTVGDVDDDGDPDIVTQGVDGLDIFWNDEGVLWCDPDYLVLDDGHWCNAARVSKGHLYVLSIQDSASRLPARIWLTVWDRERNLIARHQLGQDVIPALAVADLDGDGVEDVFGTHNERMWVAWGGVDLQDYDVGSFPSLVAAVGSPQGGEEAVVVVTGEYAEVVRVSFPSRVPVISAPLLQLLAVPFTMTSTDWDGDGALDAFVVAVTYAAVPNEDETPPTAIIADGAEWGVVTAAGEILVGSVDGIPLGEAITPFVGPVLEDFDRDGALDLAYTTTAGEYVHTLELRSGAFVPVEAVEKGIGPLYAADLDGNGVEELIGSTLGLSPVVWIRWNGGRR
jgi:hypothetical protein